jgi:hypothetical protein
MNLSPIEASGSSSTRAFNTLCYLDPCPTPYKIESFDNTRQVYYLILANIMYHVEIHIVAGSIVEPVYHDFHLLPSEESSGVYRGFEEYNYICHQSSTEVKIIIRPPEFDSNDLADFTQEEISKRYQQFKEFKPSATCPTPAMCFQT